MNEKISLRIISALVLIAAIAGIAYFAFQAGVAQGSPITIQAPSGEGNTAPVPYPYYGYGLPFQRPWGWGFGFFGCLGPLLVLFLFFFALRAFRFLFWGSRWGWGHRGPWRYGWGEGGVPPMFDEWHKRAHGGAEQPEEKQES